MYPYYCLFAYSALIAAGSLLGGWVPAWVTLTHVRMQIVLSFVGGLMLGIAVLQLMPHAAEISTSYKSVSFFVLAGLLFTFFSIRMFHFHQHVPVANAACADAVAEPELHDVHCHHDEAGHDHHHSHGHADVHQFSWTGVMFGLSLHTLIDGIALGAAVFSDASNGKAGLYGLGVFVAILLHKPLDALSITSLMAASGWPSPLRTVVNLGFALMCPLGALMVVFQLGQLEAYQQDILSATLAFSAGVFLCISLSDLLPEVQFHRHDPIKLSSALLAGVGLAILVGMLDAPHAHS